MALLPLVASDVPLAALRASDGVVLVLLALFGLWGALRGALRQGLSLLVLAGALWAAGPLAPLVAPTVGKVTAYLGGERDAVAWLVALGGCLVAGAIVISFLEPRLPERAEGRRALFTGALLGALKGCVVLLIAAYLVLGSASPEGAPMLGRGAFEHPASEAAPGVPGLRAPLRGSVAAALLARGADALTGLVDVPPFIRARVERVNADLAERRPR